MRFRRAKRGSRAVQMESDNLLGRPCAICCARIARVPGYFFDEFEPSLAPPVCVTLAPPRRTRQSQLAPHPSAGDAERRLVAVDMISHLSFETTTAGLTDARTEPGVEDRSRIDPLVAGLP